MSVTPAQLEKIQDSLICLPWVRLCRWCELTGDTKEAVYSRRHSGKWADGIHCKLADGKLWVNVPEAIRWVEKNQNMSRVA